LRRVAADRAYDLYVDHLKRCLTGTLEKEEFLARRPAGLRGHLYDLLRKRGLSVGRMRPINQDAALEGRLWEPPEHGLTMVGHRRLDNLRLCLDQIIADDVQGDVIEAGVWRGGASIFMKAILEAHGDRRGLWLADSFEGLPPPDPDRYPADDGLDLSPAVHPELSQSLETVRDNFLRYGLLDERVTFVKGWFRDTLPELRDRQWALVRLDGDLYESTMDGLTNLYPGLSAGGFLVIDDFGAIPACEQAVEDYRAEHGIETRMETIDWTGIYWRKPAALTTG
jgi:hypothetical protein